MSDFDVDKALESLREFKCLCENQVHTLCEKVCIFYDNR